ncbi:MAG: hypothetical protein A3J37_04710 [Alphaproteobacteria bacterium RIFCSPHIGHO2_12_FULL_45_9]|nr:MAG: hypothetical protein A3B66_07680 [Alphaproteobacteria bacterium RIFCSPHIGHO2_02_FULL_46_13]OFW98195.1 MAG: hypothetical protein A3J37_04710 [Alphaproteobacteria bacterium RIFCSPHIGHO2_12_FULL_45_9]
MATTVIHKLITLTNRFIEADEYRTSREIRDQLVADVFPLLSPTMRQEISNITEYNDVLKSVMRAYKDKSCYEQEAIAMVIIRRMRRGERAVRDDEALLAYATAPERRL